MIKEDPTKRESEESGLSDCSGSRDVVWNDDGSLTISPDAVNDIAGMFAEWECFAGHWTRREDCKGYATDIDARENRRESITYRNCLESMKSVFGRREINLAIERVEA